LKAIKISLRLRARFEPVSTVSFALLVVAALLRWLPLAAQTFVRHATNDGSPALAEDGAEFQSAFISRRA
ncbi:MAG: hypothetical protein ACKVGZ_18040, partial [Alphaproteobacteria bacterium]